DRSALERRDRHRDVRAVVLCVNSSVLQEALTDELVGADLELLAGEAERRCESALCEGDTYRSRGGDARHHDDGEPLPSGPATSRLGLHDFPPSRTYI